MATNQPNVSAPEGGMAIGAAKWHPASAIVARKGRDSIAGSMERSGTERAAPSGGDARPDVRPASKILHVQTT